jgi:hypothetical protein
MNFSSYYLTTLLAYSSALEENGREREKERERAAAILARLKADCAASTVARCSS